MKRPDLRRTLPTLLAALSLVAILEAAVIAVLWWGEGGWR